MFQLYMNILYYFEAKFAHHPGCEATFDVVKFRAKAREEVFEPISLTECLG